MPRDLDTRDLHVALGWVTAVAGASPVSVWESPTIGGTWSPRQTLDHLADAMLLYAAYVATRAQGRLPPPRNGDPAATPGSLIEVTKSCTAVLGRLIEGLTDDERAFHPSGLADRTGWIAMACTELLVHGSDIDGGRQPTSPETDEVAALVVGRVFPWAPAKGSGWDRLLWATGRRALGSLPADSADWWWHSAPLSEWDGAARRRDAPPQW